MTHLPNPFLPKVGTTSSKKHPGTYYKMLPKQQAQIPRYMDESGDAGLKINIHTKTYKI